MNVIASTHFNRPIYTRRLIDGLRKCSGVEDSLYVAHVEPGSDEVRSILEGIDFMETRLVFNDVVLGFGLNFQQTLDDAFTLVDYVVYFDDDLIPSPDALDYFDWAWQFGSDQSVFSVSGWNWLNHKPHESLWHVAQKRLWFHPWGSALWKDRWEAVRTGMMTIPEWSADSWITLRHVLPNRLLEIYPCYSRIQNLGWESSVHVGEGVSDIIKRHHTVPFWAGDDVIPKGEWYLAS